MQKLSSEIVKRKLVYTWYFYPIILMVSILCWIWGFNALHQPSDYEKIVLFVGAEVKDYSFTQWIIEKHKDEGLRAFEVPSCASSRSIYAQKLNLYLSSADLFILPQSTLDDFTSNKDVAASFMADYFRPITEDVKINYARTNCHFYTVEDSTNSESLEYGVAIKYNSITRLGNYINYDVSENYYLLIGITSKNTGTVYGDGNENCLNALKVFRDLIFGY